jgi:hypothetical protein
VTDDLAAITKKVTELYLQERYEERTTTAQTARPPLKRGGQDVSP